MTISNDERGRSATFVGYLFTRCQEDKGFAARLRRADNPATEYQSWDTLCRFGINLELESERLPHALIAAAIARADQQSNGGLSLGQAVARAFPDGSQSDQAKARIRRLLACDDVSEVCLILRPLLSLIRSRVKAPVDYVRLLNDLRWFNHNSERVKARWAQEFYHRLAEEESE